MSFMPDSSFSIKLNISRQKAFELVKKSASREYPPKVLDDSNKGDIDSPYWFKPTKAYPSYFSLREAIPPKENECLVSGVVNVGKLEYLKKAVLPFAKHIEEVGLELGLKRFIEGISFNPEEGPSVLEKYEVD